MREIKKIVKLPNVLIFTLERYQGHINNIKIMPEELIDLVE